MLFMSGPYSFLPRFHEPFPDDRADQIRFERLIRRKMNGRAGYFGSPQVVLEFLIIFQVLKNFSTW